MDGFFVGSWRLFMEERRVLEKGGIRGARS